MVRHFERIETTAPEFRMAIALYKGEYYTTGSRNYDNSLQHELAEIVAIHGSEQLKRHYRIRKPEIDKYEEVKGLNIDIL